MGECISVRVEHSDNVPLNSYAVSFFMQLIIAAKFSIVHNCTLIGRFVLLGKFIVTALIIVKNLFIMQLSLSNKTYCSLEREPFCRLVIYM